MAPRKVSKQHQQQQQQSAPVSVTPSSEGPTTTVSPPTISRPTGPPKVNSKQGAGSWTTMLTDLWQSYLDNTPPKLKLLDGFQLFLMLSGIAQFAYCILITNYPFNSFLGGFAATVGQFVLAASLRAQVNPKNAGVFRTISPERAFGDFVGASLLLHFFVFNYLG